MKTEAQRSQFRYRPAIDLDWREVVFDLSQARRALPYVARIARDAAEAYLLVKHCRESIERSISLHEQDLLDERREHALRRLNSAIDECNAVGADLRDIPCGVVRFSALIEGRPVSLMWRLDEPIASAWQDLDQTADCSKSQAAAALRP